MWKIYLPDVELETALRSPPNAATGPEERPLLHLVGNALPQNSPGTETLVEAAERIPAHPTEHLNAEDFEFDESEDPENSIDGMAFLTADTHKSGYTGPQSGIAALKFLQSLPPYLPITYNASPLSGLDDEEIPAAASHPLATKNRYIDYYFELYHPAYPILHEGTFRARVSGKFNPGVVKQSFSFLIVSDLFQVLLQSPGMVLGHCYTTRFLPSERSSAGQAIPKAISPSSKKQGDI